MMRPALVGAAVGAVLVLAAVAYRPESVLRVVDGWVLSKGRLS